MLKRAFGLFSYQKKKKKKMKKGRKERKTTEVKRKGKGKKILLDVSLLCPTPIPGLKCK